ncbi:ABC transporter ATP-binding protein [Enterovirga sp.]|jgi:branched-chain amino acid transport system ATP-binding protein|uniref:ABC transporter ATP-binding protein n=1 Tax=Enterovirga sp. TaxID=2026350 RepID=UPI00261D6320|nr:ABC transporter ATP-binding protein [Enterovirga sp.]MDB5591601.1 transporter related protein [Enterovirga sp.]
MSDPAATELLKLDGIGIRFGGLVAIADLSFSVGSGEVVSLIGPNGAGKTTAFNIITGFCAPSHGSISFRGQPLNGLKPHEIAGRGVVRTFQKTSLFDTLTVLENVLTGLHRLGRSGALQVLLGLPSVGAEQRRLCERAAEILDFVGLGGRQDQLANALPYGEQRLLGVAIALAADPALLLLDEPVSGMNATETTSFMAILAKIRARGITTLLVEHDMRMVMEVSDRVVVLNQGRIIASGVPSEIQRHPEVIQAYLGQGRRRARH